MDSGAPVFRREVDHGKAEGAGDRTVRYYLGERLVDVLAASRAIVLEGKDGLTNVGHRGILSAMSDQEDDDERRRDALLLQLLKTPPQPRPHRQRGKGKPTRKSDERASAERREPSA